MNSVGMIGELESKQESRHLEWEILNYSLLSLGTYKSSSFTFVNHSWYLGISKQLLSDRVFLACENQCPHRDVIFSLSIKKSDGSLTKICTNNNCTAPRHFWNDYISSDLFDICGMLLRFEIGLTIICSLKYGRNLNGEEASTPSQSAASLNENSAVETLEHVILAETGVLSKNFKDLLFNGECSDAVLRVQDKEFKAHRAVLIARSPVFAAMFKHDTSEKQTGIINVPDCDANTFQQFLEYLYSGKLESISFDGAIQLYKSSDKYDVKELKTFCTKYMKQNLAVENVCDVVILADECGETELLSAAQKFFNENLKQIVKTSEWENLLKMNYLLANKLIIEMSESKG